MGKKSIKENKNIYQTTREEMKLTREKASELLAYISEDKLYKIESKLTTPHPEEIVTMSEVYKKPSLCNYYCANECEIGKKYVPEIKIKDLSQIVLEMLNSLNAVSKKKERLVEITVDGVIDDDEIKDFIDIQNELEKISITVETLQLWAEKMLVTGRIDAEKYNELKKD